MALSTWLALLAVAAATGSVLFAAMQTRVFAKQTKLLQTTSVLSYDLELMRQLHRILAEIGDDRRLHTKVWGKADTENLHASTIALSLVDVIAVALGAATQLENFAHDGTGWIAYARYVLERSPAVKATYEAHPEWWPEITDYLKHTQGTPVPKTRPIDRPNFRRLRSLSRWLGDRA